MSYGNQFKELVKSRGLNFTLLAKRMGVSNAYISQIAMGIRRPGRATLLKLSKALEVPIDALLMIGESGVVDNSVPKKIPVLSEPAVIAWLMSGTIEFPVIYAESFDFEYALTCDPYAFYFQSSESKEKVFGYDLVLIEPISAIKNGNTVLACLPGIFLLGKILIADGISMLYDERQAQIPIHAANNIKSFLIFRAMQGIRKFRKPGKVE